MSVRISGYTNSRTGGTINVHIIDKHYSYCEKLSMEICLQHNFWERRNESMYLKGYIK